MATTRNTAIILAGGTGSRAGFGIPKQFVSLAGRMMIERSVDAFEINRNISGIIIVTNAEYADEMRKIALNNKWTKLRGVSCGGANRFASANAGLAVCSAVNGNVLIHDAARPAVSQRIIDDVCKALERFEAVNVAVPSTDSLIVSDGNTVARYLDREKIWNVQTPQGFRYATIRKAYLEALRNEDFSATDDCSVVKKYLPDTEIALVKGDANNIKLTYPEDKSRIERIILENSRRQQ